MRQIALDRMQWGSFGVEPAAWFTTITRKIDLMKVEEDRIKVFDSSQKVQVKVKRVKDGGLQLEDGDEKKLLRLKGKKNDGYEAEDGSGKRLFRAKWKNGWSLESGDIRVEGQKVLLGSASIDGTSVPEVGFCLALPGLTPLQRGSLALFLAQVGL